MLQKLLKNTLLCLALSTTTFTFGQINVSFTDPGTLQLATDGTMSGGTASFTVENIPLNTSNLVTIRTYKKVASFPTNSYNKPGFVAVDSYTLNSADADATLATYSYTTVANATNPTTHIDRTFTIINVPVVDLVNDPILENTNYAITLRFNNAGPAGNAKIPGSFVSPPASIEGGAGKHAMHELHSMMSPTLGLSKPKAIAGALVNAKEGSITVSGANLDAIYTINGQKVGATNLSHGIYIVKISKENRKATIKVAL